MELGVEITEAKDIDILPEHILYKTRKLLKADAGSIYICL